MMKVFLFTNNYPYANSETFLENEISFLSNSYDQVVIIPLEKKEGGRTVSQNTEVWPPILTFNMKDKLRLLIKGVFNLSSLSVGIKEFIGARVYVSKEKRWKFFTFFFLFRAMNSNKELLRNLKDNIEPDDILYFYWGDKSVMLLPAIKSFCQNKTFVRFHGSDLYENIGAGLIPFRKYILKFIDVALFISDNGKRYFIENYGESVISQLTVSRLGVFYRGINPVDKEDFFHIVSCSNMVPLKRLNLIVAALRLIDKRIRWTHIGSGPEMKSISDSVRELPFNINVILTGAKSNKEVIDFYQHNHIDLFVNVSETEGVPVSIMEALSCGIPVLATNVGGTGEIVDNNVGELVDKSISAAELARKILRFYNSDDLSMYRNKATERWKQLCDAEKNYYELCQILKNIK